MGKKGQLYVVNGNWWETERTPTKRVLQFVLPPETPFKANEYYRVREIADTLRLSYITVQRWIARGELEAQMIGTREYRVLGKKLIEHLGRLKCK